MNINLKSNTIEKIEMWFVLQFKWINCNKNRDLIIHKNVQKESYQGSNQHLEKIINANQILLALKKFRLSPRSSLIRS